MSGIPAGLWLRWSWRDLRRQWLVVTALAMVVAIGTGAAAALDSMATWRRLSNDSSFRQLALHDLLVTFTDDRPPVSAVRTAVTGIADRRWLARVETRLELATPVEVTDRAGGNPRYLPGRVVGVDLADGGPLVGRLPAVSGRSLTAADVSATVAVLETTGAEALRLPTTGRVRLGGDLTVDYVGRVHSAQHLLNGLGGWNGGESVAVFFVPTALAGRLAGTGSTPVTNQVLIAVTPQADPELLRTEVTRALAAALPGSPATVTLGTEDPGFRALYDDIETDQQLWDFVAMLILGGAALAAFSLTTRVVGAQRREMGIALALGLRAPWLAVRPLLFGIQVTLVGIVAGIGVGLLLGVWITDLMAEMISLPVWRTPFQPGAYLRAALLGTAIPLVGVAIPLLRVLRLSPVAAMRTVHAPRGRVGDRRHRRRQGRRRWTLPLPGRSMSRLPVRHLLRSPGRTLVTAAGMAATIATLVVTGGLTDSFEEAVDRAAGEADRRPDLTVVELDTPQPVTGEVVQEIAALAGVGEISPTLRLTGTALGDGVSASGGTDLALDLVDFDTALWTPTLGDGSGGGSGDGPPVGLVLAEKAAEDLGVRPGDTLLLEHPRWAGQDGIRTTRSRFPVSALHPGPLRTQAYLDLSRASAFGLAGTTNQLQVTPAAGTDQEQLRRELLGIPSVASVRTGRATADSLHSMVDLFVEVLAVLFLLVLLLVVLIAVNANSINADERRREHATLLAFGIRPRTVTGTMVVESLVVALLGTALGIGLGILAARWAVQNVVTGTLPDLDLRPALGMTTLLLALGVGTVAGLLAPLSTVRGLRRMNLPATLRLVE